ncbi:hypothetical protein OAO18_08955 [Francisellaceae bacterium]|nr:hypothetical protein [Francisellaceae bacterium]
MKYKLRFNATLLLSFIAIVLVICFAATAIASGRAMQTINDNICAVKVDKNSDVYMSL